MTEQPKINWPVKPYRIEVSPGFPEIPLEEVTWPMICVFSVVIILAGVGFAGVLFTLAEMGGR